MKMRNILLLAGATALTACATTVPMMPSLTAFERTDCASVPDLSGSIDLTPQKDKRAWYVDSDIRGDSRCLIQNGKAVPYLVLALPPVGSSRAVEVGALLERGRIFSPHIALLDEDGAKVRDFDNDKMMFRSSIYSVRFVPAEGERFALVTAEPALIGKAYDVINSRIVQDYAMAAVSGSSFLRGQDTEASHAFSYDGKVRGIVYRLED